MYVAIAVAVDSDSAAKAAQAAITSELGSLEICEYGNWTVALAFDASDDVPDLALVIVCSMREVHAKHGGT